MTTSKFHSLARAIATWAAIRPDAPAAVTPGEPDISWGEFGELVARHAAGMRAIGISQQHRVVILMPPSRQATLTTVATATAATSVPLDPDAPAAELAARAAILRPAVVFAAPGCAERAEALGCPVIVADPASILPLDADPIPGADANPAPDDTALIISTSGSTGEPRLVPRHHGQIVAGTLPYAHALGLGPGDRWLNVGSPQFAISSSPAITSFYTGGTALFPLMLDPADVANAMRTLRPTWAVMTPVWLRLALDALGDTPLEPSFRFVISAGAPLEPALAERIRRVLQTGVVNDYGMSENMNIAIHLPEPGDENRVRPGLRPIDPSIVAIAGENGALAAVGDVGEIITRGPQVFHGYIGDPALNEAAFLPGGWFRTGDSGYFDASGLLHITGRVSQIINRAGQRIDPAEIEAALLAHPDVAAAGVYGVPDEALGEDIRAAIVLVPGATATPRELRRWMLDRLTVTKVPRKIIFLDALPLTGSGKIARAELAAAVDAAIAAGNALPPAPLRGAEAAAAASPTPDLEPSASAVPAPKREPKIRRQPVQPDAEIAVADAPPPAPAAGNVPPSPKRAAPPTRSRFTDPRIRGPVRLLGPVSGLCPDSWALDRMAFEIEPTTPISRLIVHGFCQPEHIAGREILLTAGNHQDTFVIPAPGDFALVFPYDLPAGKPALIAFETPDPWRPGGKKRKSKNKGKNKKQKKVRASEMIHPADTRALAFVVVAIEFVPASA